MTDLSRSASSIALAFTLATTSQAQEAKTSVAAAQDPPAAASVEAATSAAEAELRKAVALEGAPARHAALRQFVAKHKAAEIAVAGHILLVRSLLASKVGAQELVDGASAAMMAISPTNPRFFQPRMEIALTVSEELIDRGEGLEAAAALIDSALTSLPREDERADRVRSVLVVMAAKAQSKMGKRDVALGLLSKAVAGAPDDQVVLLALGAELTIAGRMDEAIDAHIRAETVFGGEPTDVWALRDLYNAKYGSLAGLGERLEKSRLESMQRVALEARRTNKPAPAWELLDLAGKKLSLGELRGRVVVLDFWATWCPPCREELPALELLEESLTGKPVTILAINSEGVDDRKTWESKVRSFVAETSLKLRVLPDYEAKVNTAYNVEALPTVFVIDKDGVIRFQNVGTHPQIKQIIRAQIMSLTK